MTNKILIVDDEQELVDLFSGILATAQFQIETALDGDEAMEKVTSFEPDLILLDIQMPKVNGFTFLKQLKQNPEHQHIKVIVLSNLQGQQYLDEASRLGADDYWYKVNTHLVDLVNKVKNLLR